MHAVSALLLRRRGLIGETAEAYVESDAEHCDLGGVQFICGGGGWIDRENSGVRQSSVLCRMFGLKTADLLCRHRHFQTTQEVLIPSCI